MSNNIFSDFTWHSNTQYFKYDILTNDNINFYYAFQDFISSSSFQTDINNGNLIGYINYLGINKPYFTWRSSYKFSNDSVPIIRKIQFGDGYIQRATAGINSVLMNINFPFENITLNQCTAILHFLTLRKGVESFVFIPPFPYNIQKLFVCEKWNYTQNFYNNYTINATFLETPV